ncbi:hypothetical protein HPB51_007232 [Rhipicephalus microplus]|uniref:Uncharacterized protein n=1 Tax=Rhipicephalus microplus TaxID=6941 RepID=A0A9J6E0D0_RHIMP|nr:hypothetical protein HPB51_007232 [Rhipicephalus microplus]
MAPVVKPTRFAHAEGHTDVCYGPTGRHLVTCGSDGEVRTWEGFQDDEPKSYSVGESALAVACGGGSFFVAIDDYTVKAFEASTGQQTSVVAQFPSDVYAVACSSDGKTLVAGSGDFTLKVVEVSSGNFQSLVGHKAPVIWCCIDPQAEFVAAPLFTLASASSAYFSLSPIALVFSCPVPNAVSSSVILISRTSKVLGRLAWSPSGDKVVLFSVAMIAFKVSCGENICSLSWNPCRKELVYCNVQGQLGLVEDIEVGTNKEQLASPAVRALPEDQGDGEDDGIDLGQIKATYEPLIFGDSDAEGEDAPAVPSTRAATPVQPEYRPRLVQDAFQPSSTPVHLQHRFMVWNSVGMVWAHNTAEESSIDVEFHDTSVHHTLHRGNPLGHTMAALSDQALVLAGPQQLECFHLTSWDSNKEWAVETLSDGIQAVAVGGDWLAACCSSGMVRTWTFGGLQKAVWRAPGPVVALVASGRSLALIYHQGAGVTAERQALAVVQYNVGAGVLGPPVSVPLAERQRLAWAGYTDEGSLAYVDSDGVVSILGSSYGWTPICNTRDNVKNQSDHYFVLGVSETHQQVRALLCKGSRYPATLPRPVMVMLDFSLPYLGTESEKGQMEEELWRAWCLEEALKRVGEEGQQLVDVSNRRQLLLLKLFAHRTAPEPPVTRGNPFKVTKSQENPVADGATNCVKSRGDAGVGRRQMTLQFGAARSETAPAPTKSGVQLYVESIRATLLEEEPDLAEDQLVSRAVARFRTLSQEERAVSPKLITAD